jgi:uncharacterized protein (TIGR03032 family)
MEGLRFSASRPFVDYLHSRGRALAFTSCDGELLTILTVPTPGQLESAFFPAPVAMGLGYRGGALYMTDKFGIWRFDLEMAGEGRKAHVFRTNVRYLVGGLDLHEVTPGPHGVLWSSATATNALGVVHEDGTFEAKYRPPFISSDVYEDRCHINGMVIHEGQPAYITCVSRSDVVDGWRDRRRDGGIVFDTRKGEVVASGLSMPHSPRLIDNKLWVMNSGAGEVGHVDLEAKAFRPLTFLPGFVRGLAVDGDHFFVGLSKPRAATTFGGVPLEERLADAGAEPRCAIHLCEKATGRTIGWLRIEGNVREIFDLMLLPLRGRVQIDLHGAARPAPTNAAVAQ